MQSSPREKMRTSIRLLLLMGLLSTAQAQVISIPDPVLDAVIREVLQIPTGPLTVRDMLVLTNLDASNRGVRSLEGLESALNLAMLLLRNDYVASLSPLRGLTNLTSLDLYGNRLTNFLFLSELPSVTSLDLGGVLLTN